ncbi:MAG: 3-deoxy-manno-octulosonate cytidylyltransferase [Desulfobaccales bacterium]
MKLIALIPARYGSTRFPGKPLAPILGKPLIQRVYEQARLVAGLDELWVATDDERIRACVEGFRGRALLTRAGHLSGSDRLAEAAQLLGLAPADLVVNIQGDQPVFPPELVGQLAALLRRDPEVVMATPARKFTDPRVAADPNVVKVVFDRRGRALYFSRSPLPCWFPVSSARDAAAAGYFYRHLGIYAYRVGFLQEFVKLPPGRWEQAEKLEQLRALEHGFPIHIVETEGDTLEVDTPADLARAEAHFASGLKD